MIGGLSVAELTTLIGAATAIVLAFLEAVRRVFNLLKDIRQDLAENTKETKETKKAAQGAVKTAEEIQTAQVNLAELDYLRMWYTAFESLDECEGCKARIEQMMEGKRLRASDSVLTQRMMRAYRLRDKGE